MEQSKANKVFLVIKVLIVLWGLYYLANGILGSIANYAIINGSRKIQGVVITSQATNLTSKSVFALFESQEVTATFLTDNGQQTSIQGFANGLSNHPSGSNIPILYFVSNPQLSVIDDPVSLWGVRILEIIIGFALLIGVYNYQRKAKANPALQLEFEQSQFQKFQQGTANVNPNGFLGAQNPHITRNLIILFIVIFGGFILFALLLSVLGFK